METTKNTERDDEDLPLSTNRTRQQAADLLGEVLRHRQGLGSHGCVEVTNAIEVVDMLIADRNRLGEKSERLGKALQSCLDCLKSHHMTKPGISTLVRKTEDLLSNVQYEESAPSTNAAIKKDNQNAK